MSTEIKAFFTEYGASFEDAKKMATYYGESATTFSPEGVFVVAGKEEVAKTMAHVSEYQKKTGLISVTPGSVDAKELDDFHVWAKVHWRAMFKKTGDKPVEFDVSYLLRKTDDSYIVVASVSHQNETEMRAEVGLE